MTTHRELLLAAYKATSLLGLAVMIRQACEERLDPADGVPNETFLGARAEATFALGEYTGKLMLMSEGRAYLFTDRGEDDLRKVALRHAMEYQRTHQDELDYLLSSLSVAL